jgi:DNA gyrase subunit A
MEQFAKETHPISLEREMRRSYLDYAMSVDRGARPALTCATALKPVHRRILFAMQEANNVWNRPYVKCARVVGDVLGKYHPHGDTATYESLVRMAQDFSMRYMLIDGQGNFGSVDGDSPRPTATPSRACRRSRRAARRHRHGDGRFRAELRRQGDRARGPAGEVPNLLVNGSSGIAVGMATNIPPHNLGEIDRRSLALLANPAIDIEELIRIVPAPDFPTAGIIYGTAT